MPAILKQERASARKVVITRLGPAQVPTAGSLCDRERDFALTAGPSGEARRSRSKDGWELSANASAALIGMLHIVTRSVSEECAVLANASGYDDLLLSVLRNTPIKAPRLPTILLP